MSSFLWEYISGAFTNTLSWLGLSNKEATILFLGLDNAGKSTLLHRLVHGKLRSCKPTRYPQKDEMKIGGVSFQAYDLGGHKAAQKVWKEYLDGVHGIVYLVDAADQKRLPQARKALHNLLVDVPMDCPVLVLGNKIDLATLSESQVKHALGLAEATTGKKHGRPSHRLIRPTEVFMCSIVKEVGYVDGFLWLASML
mmetsp:Transcript_8002/g.15464  ORF Transcript_8002/g.15464 Transcript_8002/m.15464 type:complete len:197 (+) Transcript_8002:177-767(+)